MPFQLDTPKQEKEKTKKRATVALKQRFRGMTTLQRAAITEAANTCTEAEFGALVWIALRLSR